MQIEDGGGTGRKAIINDENRLLTYAISEGEEHHANEDGLAQAQVIMQPLTGPRAGSIKFKQLIRKVLSLIKNKRMTL